MLVACTTTEGGSTAVGWLVTLVAFGLWLGAGVLIVRAAGRDRTERRFLAGLLGASFVLGPLIIAAFYAGFFGNDSETGKLAVLLLLPGALGAAIAHRTRAAQSANAFLISTLGAISLVGLGIGLFLVALLVSGGDICIE